MLLRHLSLPIGLQASILFEERALESFQKALSLTKRNKKQKRRSKVKLESGIRRKIQTFISQLWRLMFYQLNYPYILSSFTSCSGSCRNLLSVCSATAWHVKIFAALLIITLVCIFAVSFISTNYTGNATASSVAEEQKKATLCKREKQTAGAI